MTASALISLAACAQQSPETPPAVTEAASVLIEPETTLDITITPPDYSAATNLIRPNMSVPDTADMSRGDVPRDDYGRPYTYEYLGQTLPAFSGPLVNGDIFTSSDLSGKWTVIEVWGLWCHDSMTDAPYAAALSTALAQDPALNFMSIHTPQSADHIDRAYKSYGSVGAYFSDKGYSYPTVVDTDASLRDILKIRWTPTYILVAPDLSVQAFRTGLADADGEPVKDFVRQISDIRGAWTP
jgi:thiol-disulfide isomerase/thioredoxin